jgi:hypothetical protein
MKTGGYCFFAVQNVANGPEGHLPQSSDLIAVGFLPISTPTVAIAVIGF